MGARAVRLASESACGLFAFFALVSAGGAALADEPSCEKPNMLIIVDRSGSMLDPVDADTKYQVARNAVERVTRIYSSLVRFGLALFPSDGDCAAGVVKVPVGDYQSEAIVAAMDKPESQPGGGTPIAATLGALSSEASILDSSRRNFVLFMTDGGESCGGDTATEARNLHGKGVGILVVGFGSGVDDWILDDIATAGGYPRPGTPKYYAAENAADLDNAFYLSVMAAVAEICDGRDNDCNGLIDDAIAPQECIGLCGVKGTRVCENTAWTSCRTDSGSPVPESGQEGTPCETGMADPACGKGVWKCNAAMAVDCVPTREPGDETCNGLDDDCNGQIDDTEPRRCVVCGVEGVRMCEGGALTPCLDQAGGVLTADGENCNDSGGSFDSGCSCSSVGVD